MYKEMLRPVWAEINLANLDYNIKNIKARIGEDKEIIGIIKADAYGHGALATAQVLRKNGVTKFAIATLHEAISLRESGASEEIIMLGLTPDIYAKTLIEYEVTPVVNSYENALAFSNAAEKMGKIVEGFIVVDTGMGRIGYVADDVDFAVEDIKKIAQLPNFKIKGMFSHLSCADDADKSFSKQQEQKYLAFRDALIAAGIEIKYNTFANSAAIIDLPTLHFDAVRPGIIMYGCYPSDDVDKSVLDLKPVMSIKANIMHLKEVPAGFSVSYGRKFITDRPSKIATITLGYADGYPRPYSPYAKVLINGVVAPIAGNICMDQCMIDVTDVPDVKLGDEVIIIGSDGKNSITVDDIAKATNTIKYEIMCALGQRLPKKFIK